jgi:hypothetical protein
VGALIDGYFSILGSMQASIEGGTADRQSFLSSHSLISGTVWRRPAVRKPAAAPVARVHNTIVL